MKDKDKLKLDPQEELQKLTKPTVAEIIQNMPLDPEYLPGLNMPIPLHKGVIVKKIIQKEGMFGSIIIPQTAAENAQYPRVGIIYAVGPNCSEHVRPGLRCYYNYNCDLTVLIDGVEYVLMDEPDVYYILNSTHRVLDDAKDSETRRKEKKLNNQDAMVQRLYNREQNEKDIIEERLKKLRPKGKA